MIGTKGIFGPALSRIALVACLAATAMPALAQETKTETGDEAAISDIVVTARQRAESLQRVPDAITAFSSQQITDARIESVGDFAQLTANVDFIEAQQPGVFQLIVRGITQVENGPGDPPIAFVIDGVNLPTSSSITQALDDLERIEVLKGPQGALYGKGAIAGAINITTKEPTDRFEGEVRARYSNGDDRKIYGMVSGPIVGDRLLFRVTGSYRKADGLLKSAFDPGQRFDFLEESAVRGRLLFKATDRLTFDASLAYQKVDGGAAPIALASEPAGPFAAQGFLLGEVNGDVINRSSRKVTTATFKADLDLDSVTLSSISAYQWLKTTLEQDLDATRASMLEIRQPRDATGFTQEIRLTSASDQRLRWIVGGFYQTATTDIDGHLKINANFPDDTAPANAVMVPFIDDLQRYKNSSLSGFAQINYDLTDTLELTAALRYDRARRRNSGSTIGIPTGGEIVLVNQSATFERFQPKVSIAYKPTGDLLFYASYSQGFRPGGFNPSGAAGSSFPAETTGNYEAGFKASLFDRKLRVNGAIFYTDYTNQQFELIDGANGTQAAIAADKSRAKGFELEVSARPFRHFDLTGGFGYTHAKVISFTDIPGLAFDTSTFEGKWAPKVPRYTLNLSAQFTPPITDTLEGVARIDFTRKGRVFWHPDNLDTQAPYNLVNARLGVRTDRWSIGAYADNLFNKRYDQLYFASEWSGIPSSVDIFDLSKPRTYGIEASFQF